jgi:phosphoribosylaminoimidazolecarboxamide formyltransferase / IMP cyclohydrolase
LKRINTALISVYYKDGLNELLAVLARFDIKIYSTGGTYNFIKDAGYDVTAVEDLTDYPSILGGRVKTLHPKVFGGILARRDHPEDIAQLDTYDIPAIDLVVVDLYPFEETVASTAEEQAIIEKIDIGGVSLIRAGAKNFKDTAIIAHKDQYSQLTNILTVNSGSTSLEDRRQFAREAFNITSHYDSAIFRYFAGDDNMDTLKVSYTGGTALRYGENPHQRSTYFGNLDGLFEQLNGKQLSYNNLVDIDAGVQLIKEFSAPTFAILKHTNPCGVASRDDLVDAWKDALAADPVSAFGGVLVTNNKVDIATAEAMHSLFFEVLIAPAYDPEALALLSSKKNRILLLQKHQNFHTRNYKTLLDGVIVQDADLKTETAEDLKTATQTAPTDEQVADLLFANIVAKHLKSNTIVLAKNKQLLSMGCGQTSRVDALKQAILKAKSFGFDLQGAVMASDAFFPFPDCVEIAHEAGIKAVIQPGGSIKDQDSIDFCNTHGMSMVLTGVRHFKH